MGVFPPCSFESKRKEAIFYEFRFWYWKYRWSFWSVIVKSSEKYDTGSDETLQSENLDRVLEWDGKRMQTECLIWMHLHCC